LIVVTLQIDCNAAWRRTARKSTGCGDRATQVPAHQLTHPSPWSRCPSKLRLRLQLAFRLLKAESHFHQGWRQLRLRKNLTSCPGLVDHYKARAYRELEKLGVTPSELMRQALQYLAERGQLPFKPILMTEDDEALIAMVRERLAAPQRVKVSLDDL